MLDSTEETESVFYCNFIYDRFKTSTAKTSTFENVLQKGFLEFLQIDALRVRHLPEEYMSPFHCLPKGILLAPLGGTSLYFHVQKIIEDPYLVSGD